MVNAKKDGIASSYMNTTLVGNVIKNTQTVIASRAAVEANETEIAIMIVTAITTVVGTMIVVDTRNVTIMTVERSLLDTPPPGLPPYQQGARHRLLRPPAPALHQDVS